jgi:hypothetical protein
MVGFNIPATLLNAEDFKKLGPTAGGPTWTAPRGRIA